MPILAGRSNDLNIVSPMIQILIFHNLDPLDQKGCIKVLLTVFLKVFDWNLHYVDTVCPRSSDLFYIVTYFYKLGHCFLDTQYVTSWPGSVKKGSICMRYIWKLNSLDILYAGTRSRIGNSQSPTMQLHYSSMLPQGLWKLLEAAQGTARGGCRVGLIPPIQAITVCPWSSDPFNVVTYFIKWVTTSWTYSITGRLFLGRVRKHPLNTVVRIRIFFNRIWRLS